MRHFAIFLAILGIATEQAIAGTFTSTYDYLAWGATFDGVQFNEVFSTDPSIEVSIAGSRSGFPLQNFEAHSKMGSLIQIAHTNHNGLHAGGGGARTKLDGIDINVSGLDHLPATESYPIYWKIEGTVILSGSSGGPYYHFVPTAGITTQTDTAVGVDGSGTPLFAFGRNRVLGGGDIGLGGGSGLLAGGNYVGDPFAIYVPMSLYTLTPTNILLVNLDPGASTDSVDGVASAEFRVTFDPTGSPELFDSNLQPLNVSAHYGFVPEPSTLVLGCTGLIGLAFFLRRRVRRCSLSALPREERY